MKRFLLLTIGSVFCVLLPQMAWAGEYVTFAEWQPQPGASFLADTQNNIGYLINPDGVYTRILIGSGQRRMVSYIGRYYNATTPVARWVVQSTTQQPMGATFGDGRFFRLYRNGEQRTAYGIHGTSNIDWMLQQDQRYFSMGCLLVHPTVLDVMGRMFELNQGSFVVTTRYGVDERELAK